MSISTMKRLTVLSPVGESDALVRRLMRLRCVEIRTVPPDDDGTLMRHDCEAVCAEAEGRVEAVSAAIPYLDRYTDKPTKRRAPIPAEGRDRAVEHARERVGEILRIKAAVDACLGRIRTSEAEQQALRPWLEYDAPLSVETTETCSVWLGIFPVGTSLVDVDRALGSLEASITEVERDEGGVYVSVICRTQNADAIGRVLDGLDFARVRFKDADGTPKEAYDRAADEIDALHAELEGYAARMRELAREADEIRALYDVEMDALITARHRRKLAATESCVCLEGWVPVGHDERVARALGRMDCAFEMTDPLPGEEPPVLLRNNGYASNFEWVVGMYAYPKYGSFDPTFIMSLFYFVIFGLMFADVGYGALLVLAGFLAPKVMHMKPSMKRMLNMFGYCGIACTVLGFVFGGWFGDLPYAIMTGFMGYESTEAAKAAMPIFNGLVVTFGGEPLALNPLENPMTFLIISLVMGGIHLLAAMAVKFYVLCRQKQVFAAIFDVGSWWIIFAGIGCIFISSTVGWVMIGVGALMIVATAGRDKKNPIMRLLGGLLGLYDIVSYASDLLSYSRILALGLAAGVIAQVVNLMATMGGPTVPGILLLIFVMLIGHVLNMAINLLGAFVHTSRLQYLEFFGKFYEDGGVPFEPALPSEKYTVCEPEGDATEEA